jgi:subtilisin family serine protease
MSNPYSFLPSAGAVVLLALVALCPFRSAAAPAVAEPPSRYLVGLEGEPAAASFVRARTNKSAVTSAVAAGRRAAEIAAQHETLSARLRSLGVVERARLNKLVNVLVVDASSEQAAAMRSLPGVQRVQRVRVYEPQTAASVPFIGTPAVWGGTPAADGSGIRIGIIDTGIDYTHADFGGSGVVSDYITNNRTIIQPGTFPTAKVVGGWDFVGDAYDFSSTNNIPQPDPNPIDCAGHGSHVAGIAAGFGVLTNGATYAGPYTNGMDFSKFEIGPGVAPAAKLYALKIFGCAGSTGDDVILQALEWAADPNGDANFELHLDVVNISVGSQLGLTGPGDPLHDALNLLADLGCTAAISAGNNGDVFYIVSSPGTTEKAICVACSTHNRTVFQGMSVLAPSSIASTMAALEGIITVPLAQTGPIQGTVIYAQPNSACSGLANSLSGDIALIDRGTCSFASKILNAQAAGAIAVIMVNNVPGDPITMGGSSTGITIPGVMVSQSDGALIKAHLNEGVVARLGADILIGHPQQADLLADFTSRGPAAPANLLKPDISAPGFSIASAKAGGGTLAAILSGTSMSSPHVAGAAGLLRQLHPDWSTEEIKAVLMNTSRQTYDAVGHPYPESREGAGRLEIDDAARAVVTAKAENSGGLVSLSFGALDLTQNYTNTSNIVLSNHSADAVTYAVAITNTVSENGVSLASPSNSVTVPGNGSILVPMQFTANPALFDRTADPTTTNKVGTNPRQLLYETSGEVWFLNTNLSIHVPYYANVRAASSFHIGQTNFTLALTNAPLTLTFPMAGASAHPQPLVSAFQLGAFSPNQSLGSPTNAADLLVVGAASDAATQSQFANSTIFFGIGVAGNWATPQYYYAEFDVHIDTNFDGIDDFVLYNNSYSSSFSSLSDAFASDLFVETNGPSTLPYYLDYYAASARDTAPFNNSVLVLPVSAKALGLTVGSSRFRYQVVSYALGSQEDQTDWITFDAARPVLDAASFGLDGEPFFADGTPVMVKADASAAADNGYFPLNHASLLLLHHFNTEGNRFDVVDIQFAPQFFPPVLQGGHIFLSWSSASNAVYTLQFATSLSQGFVFTAATGLAATPPVNTFLDSHPPNSTRYYRLVQH